MTNSSEAPPDAIDRPETGQWRWLLLSLAVATLPVAGMFDPSRVFHVRDLGLFFWGRYLWLRRSLWDATVPLWDPYTGGGQSTVADALNQLFCVPTLVIRMLGPEALGFNLWVGLPFPTAAAGAFFLFAQRFSGPAAALGAITFAVSGPVVSTGNFPNMSWAVAAAPWVVGCVLRVVDAPSRRSVAALALAIGLQALAGEPVTQAATLAIAFGLGATEAAGGGWHRLGAAAAAIGAATALGLGLSAVQLLPLASAVEWSWRPHNRVSDFWSLHPLTLLEVVSPYLFGNYFKAENFSLLPWLLPLNSGRDPFFYSIYLGPTVLALALYGVVSGPRKWATHWVFVAALGLACAFGAYSPVYGILHALPVVGTFRFPVKFLIAVVMAVSALVAASWDALGRGDHTGAVRWKRRLAIALPLAIAAASYLASAGTIYAPEPTARFLWTVAQQVGVFDPALAAELMLRTLPTAATRVVLFSLAGALFFAIGTSLRPETRLARSCLFALIIVELSFHAFGINPMFAAENFEQPTWVERLRTHPDLRFYFGGKVNGTLEARDLEGVKAFVRPQGMSPVEGRSYISNQAVFFPSAWHVRELLSYDLAVLWPREFALVENRFHRASLAERDRFLDRTATKYRTLPDDVAGSRRRVAELPAFYATHLYEEDDVSPRAYVAEQAIHVPELRAQVERLFQLDPGFQSRIALLEEPPAAVGTVGPPTPPSAAIVVDGVNRVVVRAATGALGGFLVLLDTYTKDWQVTVDGAPATLLRANVLFRAVRLQPGPHLVEFAYRPRSMVIGAAVSVCSALLMVALAFPVSRRRRHAL